MQSLSWPSFGFYLLFSLFVFFQQLHIKNFRGESEAFRTILTLSALAGVITELVYLGYYGWTVSWSPPVILFIVRLVAIGILAALAEYLFGAAPISVSAFIGWPVSAYFMFLYIPHA
jgi:ABC-type thiamin/hydroxymethylpyrimidine transport system permease subunit